MLDLSEITRRAKEASRQSADVEVIFDAGLTETLDQLRTDRARLVSDLDDVDETLKAELEQIEKDRRVSDPRPAAARRRADTARADISERLEALDTRLAEVEEAAAEFLVTFRFTAMHGFEWRDLCSRSTPRADVVEDVNVGYNRDDVTRIAAARSGVRIDGDTVIEVTEAEWAGVWETLPAPGLVQIKNIIWYLNEYSWVQARDQAVVAARKASTGRPAATPPSPSDSGSTPADSQGGNPPSSPSTSTETTAA